MSCDAGVTIKSVQGSLSFDWQTLSVGQGDMILFKTIHILFLDRFYLQYLKRFRLNKQRFKCICQLEANSKGRYILEIRSTAFFDTDPKVFH